MSPASDRRPILVTGSHRSGSTWVGKMIAASPRVAYIHEPFNVQYRRPGIMRAPFTRWLEYVPPGTGGLLRDAFADTLAFRYQYAAALRDVRSTHELLRMVRDAAQYAWYRLGRKRPLLKDPLAIFSAEWLQETFDMQVVVVVRHPAAFAMSIQRLGWRISFAQLLEQDALLRDLLAPYADEIREAAATTPDLITEAALVWKLIHHAVSIYQERHPEWIFVRHEDLSIEPMARFAEIFERLGLEFTEGVRRTIARSTSEDNPPSRAEDDPHATKLDSRANAYRWRDRLRPQDVLRIRTLVEPYGSRFYRDDEW